MKYVKSARASNFILAWPDFSEDLPAGPAARVSVDGTLETEVSSEIPLEAWILEHDSARRLPSFFGIR